ncbi:MAG: Rrf2 family transcriptional regulator [Brevinematales bacterium]|nr:Rrf2 family transcriptional regulator [Brevinematales bacterium]
MRLTTKTRYGLRLLLGFALRYNKGYVQLNEVAKAEGVTEKYAEQIVRILKIGGLLTSQRGVQGGYILSYPPEKITVFQVVETLEGKFSIIDCVDKKNCERISTCVVRKVWSKLTEDMIKTLKSITLADLVEDYKKENSAQVTYEI